MSTVSGVPAPPTGPLRSGSVRLRVTAGVLVVLAVVLAALSVGVGAVFAAQSERSLDALLTGRVQLARQLARSGLGPQQIVNRVTTDGVQAQLTLRSGVVVGTPIAPGTQVRSVQTRLPGTGRTAGSTLTLAVDASLLTQSQSALRRLLLIASLVALAVSALLVAVTVRVALRPLDRVASLARGITEGRRGDRLRPAHAGTEIGQTAQALDEMLDELEGAEARARAAEQRSRAFLADAAHELRTPIAGVRAAAETLLHAGADLDAEQRDRLEALVIREADRVARLVGDLLSAARLDAGIELRLRPVSLRALVEAEVQRVAFLAPEVRASVVGPDVELVADPDQVAGILRNVTDNALRAVAGRGTVAYALEMVQAHDGAYAIVEITDSGPGVPAADRDRIFDRLVRLDAARSAESGGSGLGLAIARGWARAHGGDLTCEEPMGGGGARFRLALPQRAPVASGGVSASSA